MNHFKPKFLLGMSATPERTDGYNIVEVFDYNIAYEIRLQHAMEYDLLCPFHYFGVQEFVADGELVGDKADFNKLVDKKRIDHIMGKIDYYGYSGNRVRGLVFCSRKDEAKALSKLFNDRGYQTTALTGESSEESRRIAIDRLEKYERDGGLDYIFTVDIFNEGIDIPRVNQVVMLRPTESSIIFIQQLGRGLRKAEDKEYVVVLDFIGNYENNFMIPMALSGDRTYNKDTLRRFAKEGNSLIPGCSTINFDEVTRSKIYESINRAKFSQLTLIKKEYNALKNVVGRVPTLTDFYEHGAIDPELIFAKCKSYYDFLLKYEAEFDHELNEEQLTLLRFVTTEFGNGHRPHEAVIIQLLVEKWAQDGTGQVLLSLDEVTETLQSEYGLFNQEEEINHSLAILEDSYLQNKDRKKYGDCRFVSAVGEIIRMSEYLGSCLEDTMFFKHFTDLLNTYN